MLHYPHERRKVLTYFASTKRGTQKDMRRFFNAEKLKQYTNSRRRTAWFLAAVYVIAQFAPQVAVVAAPQMFASPTAGVSRAPLGVARFDTPGFGDLEDAVNLANGNVFAALDGVSRNNLTNSEDETANSMGGKWQITPRLRLYEYSANLIQNILPTDPYWTGYFDKPNSMVYRMASQDGGCGTNSNSGIMRFDSIPAGTYKVSFLGRTESGVLPVWYGTDDGHLVNAMLTTEWQWFSASFNLTQADARARLFEILEQSPNNPAWYVGSVLVERTSDNTGNLVATQDLTSTYFTGWCARPAITASDSGMFMTHDSASNPGTNYSGIIRFDSLQAGTYTVSFKARSFGNNLSVGYGLSDANIAWRELTPLWQTISTQFTLTQTDARRFEIFEFTKNNVPWEISEVDVRSKSSVPTQYTLGTGDGTNAGFSQRTPPNLAWFADKPNWVSRYKGSSDAAPTLSGVVMYERQSLPGRQHSSEWLVRVPVGSGQGFVVHHYAQDGTRTTFYGDGEYADFVQTASQQLRSAQAGDPEGLAANSPKTQLSYTDMNSGRIERVRDEWGRVSRYVWNSDGTVAAIYHLLRSESDLSTWTRVTDFGYETIANERVLTYMAYRAFDGVGNTQQNIQGRWFDFGYRVENGRVLLDNVRRPTLSKLGVADNGTGGTGWRTTTYSYDTNGRVTKASETGRPDILYTYGTSSDFKGPMVTVVQCSTLLTTSCPADNNRKQTEFHFDTFGRLRKQRLRDYNPFVAGAVSWFQHNGAAQKFLETTYSYYRNGNTALITEPSGRTTHFVYDTRQNLTRKAVYASNPFSPEFVIPVNLGGNYKQIKGQTASFTARVRDLANAGVKWQIRQGASVLWDSDSAPGGNGYASATNIATGVDGDFKTYTLTFNTPASTYTNPSAQYTMYAISKTDSRQFSDVNFIVTPRVKRIDMTLPPRVIVVPGCVEAGGDANQKCGTSATSRGAIRISGALTPTEGFSISDARITGKVTSVSGSPTLNPSDFTVSTDTNGIFFQPPAWSTARQAQSYTVNLEAASYEDPTVKTTFTLQVGYLGIVASKMYSDVRFPGGKNNNWTSYLSSSEYQHWVSIMNPPTSDAPLIANWSASGGGTISPTNSGCLRTSAMAFWDGPRLVSINVSIVQYPQATLAYSDMEYFTAWDNFHGCASPSPTGIDNLVYGSSAVTPNQGGTAMVRTQSLGSSPNPTGAAGSQTTNTEAQRWNTDTTEEPEFPSDVRAGYVRDERATFNDLNLPLEQIQPAITGSNFSYGEVKQVHAYTYHSVSSGGQSFSSLATHRVGTQVNGAEKRNTLATYDVEGRLRRMDRVGAGQTSSSIFTFNFADGQTWDVYSPYALGSGQAAGWRSAISEPRDIQFRDLPDSVTENSRVTWFRYDQLSNMVFENCINCYAKNIVRESNSTATVTNFNRAKFRTFNGYNQQVWEAVYSHNGSGDDKWESAKMWRYYSSGELDASFEESPNNLVTYHYDTNPGSDHFGRLTTVKKGVDSDANGTLETEREVTTLAYDKFGRVTSSATNGQNTDFIYDTQDRFTQSISGAPEQRFVYRTYSSSGTPDYDCSGSLAVNTLTHCQYRTVDSLGRSTAVMHATNGALTDANDTYWYEYIAYDAFDRPIRQTDDRLQMNESADDRTTKMRYDDEGRLLMMVGPKLRSKATNGYTDSRRSAVQYTYDDLGRKTKEAIALNGAYDINSNIPDNDAAITTLTYNNLDRVTRTTDARGYTTDLKYDEIGNGIESKRLIGGTTYAVTQTAYDAMGRPTLTIDPMGKISKVAYNLLGLKVREINARGIGSKIYQYTPDGLLERVYEPRVQVGYTNETVASGLNLDTLEGYQATKRYVYGANSRFPLKECSPYLDQYDANNDGNCTTKTTDAIGRVTKDTLSDGGEINRTYDLNGNITSVTDADGFITNYEFDAFKRLRKVEQKARAAGAGATVDSTAGLSGGLISTYGYDLAGNLTRKTERGLTTRYEYNVLGRVTAETRAHTAAVTNPLYKKNTYRLDGGRTAETNYSYAGSLGSYAETWPRVATMSGTPTVTEGNVQVFELDALGNVIGESSRGKASDGTILTEKVAWYSYNGLNQRVYRDFNGHEAIYQAQRNPDGKFRLVSNNGDSLNPMGTMNTQVYTNWQYDLNGRLTWKADSLASDFSNPFNTFSYNWSETGKLLSSARDVKVKIPAFQNDANLGQTVTLAATNGYVAGVYNSRDQIWQVNVEDQSADGINTIGAKFNRITQYGYYVDGLRSSATVLLWDGGGVGTGTKGVQTFTYDKRGREISRTDSDGAADTRERSSNMNGVIGVGTGTASSPSAGDVLKTLLDRQLTGSNGGLQPARPVKGTATITTTYGAGSRSMKIVDGNGKCLYQQDLTLAVGGNVHESKEWEWEPAQTNSDLVYQDVVCGISTPSRTIALNYNANGFLVQQNFGMLPAQIYKINAHQGTSNVNQQVTYTNDAFGSLSSQAVNMSSSFNGQVWGTVQTGCQDVSKRISVTSGADNPYRYESCNGTEHFVTAPIYPDSMTVGDYAERKFANQWVSKTANASESYTLNINYDSNGNQLSENRIHNVDGTEIGADYEMSLNDYAGNISFVLDSQGKRLKIFSGKYNGYIKRYNADDQPAMFFRWEGSSSQPYAAYSDFRYDPLGNEVLSSTGGIIQRIGSADSFTIKRNSTVIYGIDNQVQLIRKRVGDITQTTNSYVNSNLIRDQTYSSADGVNDSIEWSALVLFDSVSNSGNAVLLEAPTTPLSVTTRVEPNSISAPNQGVPSTNPVQVAPPTSNSGENSSSILNSTSPEFGVRLITLASPASNLENTPGVFTSENAFDNPVNDPQKSVNTSTVFRVQIGNLEPPSSVLPESISQINALDIVSSQTKIPDSPDNGLSDPSGILPPNAPPVLPSIGVNSADNPGTIQAPTSITNPLPPTVTSGVGSIIPPESASNIKPLVAIVLDPKQWDVWADNGTLDSYVELLLLAEKAAAGDQSVSLDALNAAHERFTAKLEESLLKLADQTNTSEIYRNDLRKIFSLARSRSPGERLDFYIDLGIMLSGVYRYPLGTFAGQNNVWAVIRVAAEGVQAATDQCAGHEGCLDKAWWLLRKFIPSTDDVAEFNKRVDLFEAIVNGAIGVYGLFELGFAIAIRLGIVTKLASISTKFASGVTKALGSEITSFSAAVARSRITIWFDENLIPVALKGKGQPIKQMLDALGYKTRTIPYQGLADSATAPNSGGFGGFKELVEGTRGENWVITANGRNFLNNSHSPMSKVFWISGGKINESEILTLIRDIEYARMNPTIWNVFPVIRPGGLQNLKIPSSFPALPPIVRYK
jgi:YD repeat-containing protein